MNLDMNGQRNVYLDASHLEAADANLDITRAYWAGVRDGAERYRQDHDWKLTDTAMKWFVLGALLGIVLGWWLVGR